MTYKGLVIDKSILPDGVTMNNPYLHNKCRIYKEDVDMATDKELGIIDDRIFLRELEIIQSL